MAPSRRFFALLTTALVAALPSQGGYLNPVYGSDSPDPGVVYDSATSLWWATTTTGDAPDRFLLHSSPDLSNFTARGFIWPRGAAGAPSWGVSDFWAPEIHAVGKGYVLYFVARTHAGVLSVGAAVSTTGAVNGPFSDIGAPLVGDASMGQIDPTYFLDVNGTPYLIWKEDGNAVGARTPIRYAQLTPNGTALAPGGPDWRSTQLITNDLPWEGSIIEAPWMTRFGSEFFLFYSANDYTQHYCVSVARAPAPTGPFVKLGTPLMTTSTATKPKWTAPGHCSVVEAADGGWAMVYHAWRTADRNSGRQMLMDRVEWPAGADGTWPAMTAGDAPTDTEQPLP